MFPYKIVVGLFVLIALLACNNKPADSHHAHDVPSITATVYTDSLEIFADIQPLWVNHASVFAVHFTNLSTFKPVDAGELTFSLIVGSNGLRTTQKMSHQKGIYSFKLSPGQAGLARLEITGIGDQSITLASLQIYVDEHSAMHSVEQSGDDQTSIAFAKEQAWKVQFSTGQPAFSALGEVINGVASVSPSPEDRMVVASKTSGFVRFANGVVSAGQHLSKGQVPFKVVSDGLTENNAVIMLHKAQAELELAEAEYERDKTLATTNVVSNRELIESKAAYQKALTDYNNLKRTVDEEGECIRMPKNGYVHEVFVQNGGFIEGGSPVFSLVEQRRLLLTASVSRSHLRALQTLQQVNVQMNDGSIVPLEALNGKVLSVGRVLDGNHMLPVVMEVDYQHDLVAGGFTNVALVCGAQKELSVPNSALTEEQGVFFVYVQLTPEQFEKRQVITGASDGINTAILSGLKPDERLVTQGAVFVKLAAVSNAVDPHAGHVH